jgi:hypothetical protein
LPADELAALQESAAVLAGAFQQLVLPVPA